MTMTSLILPTILSCIIAYLLCGIPFGLLVARAHGVDVRKVGSGNIGTTNVARAAGVGASGLTLLLDAGKGFVSMMIARLIIPAMGQVEAKAIAPDQPAGIVIAIVYVACICGHVFSCYLKFHGGKGIATGFGGALAIQHPQAPQRGGEAVLVQLREEGVGIASRGHHRRWFLGNRHHGPCRPACGRGLPLGT